MRAICIGECMVELRATGADTFARGFAGDVYNTAVYLKRSLPEAQVQFLTCSGDDAMSRTMREAWSREGIEAGLAFSVDGASPGLYLIETDAQGERRFQYWRSNSAARRWLTSLQDRGEALLRGADLVYLSGISLAILTAQERVAALELLGRLRPHVGHIAFDPNIRLALWESAQVARQTLQAAFAICGIVLPSTDDAQFLFDTSDPLEQAAAFRECGVRELALTLGARGCLVADGTALTSLAAPAVDRVVDTSGAGDSFNGAYLAARLRGLPPTQAAQAGLAVGARVVTHTGAVVPASVSHPADPHR